MSPTTILAANQRKLRKNYGGLAEVLAKSIHGQLGGNLLAADGKDISGLVEDPDNKNPWLVALGKSKTTTENRNERKYCPPPIAISCVGVWGNGSP